MDRFAYQKTGGEFQEDRGAIKQKIKFNRLSAGLFGTSGLLCFFLSLLNPQMPKDIKLQLLIGSSISLGCLSYALRRMQRGEKLDETLDNLTVDEYKQLVKIRAGFNKAIAEMNGELDLAEQIARLPAHQQVRYAQKFQLGGLFAPPQAAVITPSSQSISSPQIVSISDAEVKAIVDPGAVDMLNAIAREYPDYVRMDDGWLDEICDSASNHNMTQRANHHFYLAGGTQSGKSTLAGVIVNKIAAKSQGAAYVFGSDPKDGVSRWLCQFSQKFDGMETLTQWIPFLTKKIDDRKKEVAKVGGGCEGISEMFLLQDEVDTVFGGGKGFPGLVDKETAVALQAAWNYIIKFTAGLKCHGIFMGQSPLSGATGFSRPEYKNVCFVALGAMSSYILDNPKDFLNSVKKDVLEALQTTCELFDKAGLRYALVVPTKGNPFVAKIPVFNIPKDPRSHQPSQPQPHPTTEQKDPLLVMKELCDEYNKQSGKMPTDEEIAACWQDLTGKTLNPNGISELKRAIGGFD